MKVAFIAAGAAGMYCGSCLRDTSLAVAMKRLGHDLLLIPFYTPLRTDREDVSIDRIFYGGINVFLEQKSAFFRRKNPLQGLLDSKPLLRLASKFAGMTNAAMLGELTVSVLKGEEGNQRKELEQLVEWLADDVKPDIVNLPNSMFVGLAREIRRRTGAPVVCSLSGEDVFYEGLIEPYKSRVIETLRERAGDVDGYIAVSRFHADTMAPLLDIDPEKIAVVPLGLQCDGYERKGARPTEPFTVGYLARIAPEKGLHLLCEAVAALKKMPGAEGARLRAAGYLGSEHKGYLREVRQSVEAAGMTDSFEYVGEVTFDQKQAFLESLSLLSVPTIFPEPKGLFVLEALAHGLPVVQPAHGAFPEMIEATGGGVLFEPGNADALAGEIYKLLRDPDQADRLARRGQDSVRERFTADDMARETVKVYNEYLK
ncbi:glycosyltransferase family 4 protein [Candidatus Sumerlaeota bacterium]|nr:glycosyltransferase family 4 protein [Candidatus Sumerlaeota bacterium]